MNIKNKYFRLFASCIPVKGINSSLIYDLQRIEVFEISNEIYDIIPVIESNTIEDISRENPELFKFLTKLVEEEIGFFCEDTSLFPKLNTKWDLPNIISNAIIEISDKSDHDFYKIFKALDKLLCRDVLLILYDIPDEKAIYQILTIASENNVHYIEIWSKGRLITRKITRNFKNIRKIVILNSKKEYEVKVNHVPVLFMKDTSFKNLCSNATQKYNLSQVFYNESLKYNSCLNRKLSIDKDRKIKNCPFSEEDFGNYIQNNIIETVNSEKFQKLWFVNKDKINECKDCQYRYMCKDCRTFTVDNKKYNKPSFCNFSPYLNKVNK